MSEIVSECVSEIVSEIVSEWVSEIVSECVCQSLFMRAHIVSLTACVTAAGPFAAQDRAWLGGVPPRRLRRLREPRAAVVTQRECHT